MNFSVSALPPFTICDIVYCSSHRSALVSEVLEALLDIMKTNFEGKVCEEQLLKTDHIGKLLICIDEMISDVSFSGCMSWVLISLSFVVTLA